MVLAAAAAHAAPVSAKRAIKDQLNSAELARRRGRNGQEVTCLEQALAMQRAHYGPAHIQTIRAELNLAARYNAFGLRLLTSEHFQVALEVFRKGLALTAAPKRASAAPLADETGRLASFVPRDWSRSPELQKLVLEREQQRATTLSNMACLYRRFASPREALRCISACLRLESQFDRRDKQAESLINLSTILSDLGRHRAATEAAQQALESLQLQLSRKLSKDAGKGSESTINEIHVHMAIAYHNIAVEHEHTKRPDLALQMYHRGAEFALSYLTAEHELTMALIAKYKSLSETMKLLPRERLHRVNDKSPPTKLTHLNMMVSSLAAGRKPLIRKAKPAVKSGATTLPRVGMERGRSPEVMSRNSRTGPPNHLTTKTPITSRNSSRMSNPSARDSARPNSRFTRLSARTSTDVVRSLFAVEERALMEAEHDRQRLTPHQLSRKAPAPTWPSRATNNPSRLRKVIVEFNSSGDDDGYWSDGPFAYACHGGRTVVNQDVHAQTVDKRAKSSQRMHHPSRHKPVAPSVIRASK